MGFWDNMKKAGEYAQKGLEIADQAVKKNAKKMSTEHLKKVLEENPNNKYALEELERRGEI